MNDNSAKYVIFDSLTIQYNEMSHDAQQEFDRFHKEVALGPILSVDEKVELLGEHFETLKRLIFSN